MASADPDIHLAQSPSSTFCPAKATVVGTPTCVSTSRGASMVLGGSIGGDIGGDGGVGGGAGCGDGGCRGGRGGGEGGGGSYPPGGAGLNGGGGEGLGGVPG
eukprot:scaffold239556_cov43-Tisochrysis_lutea.AAC.1